MRLILALALAFVLFGCIAIPVSKNVTTHGNVSTNPPRPITQPPVQPPIQPVTPTPSQPPAQVPSQPPNASSNGTVAPPTPPPSSQLSSSEISYMSAEWEIYGTLYDSKNPNPSKAIILAHMLGADRSEWPQDLIVRLHDEVPDALILAIDMRGNGKSTNMGTYQNFDMSAYKNMKLDITSADTYLGSKYPTVKELYVVGSSMGSTAAILAAQQDPKITKVAMISPGMKYHDVDITQAIQNYPLPLLVVAAGNDAYSVQAVHAIDSLVPPAQITSKVYVASSHGAALITETASDTEPLSDMLVTFLK